MAIARTQTAGAVQCLLVLLAAFAGRTAFAEEFPLRDASQLRGEATDVVRVTSARILLADKLYRAGQAPGLRAALARN